jgi:hypothetical protein
MIWLGDASEARTGQAKKTSSNEVRALGTGVSFRSRAQNDQQGGVRFSVFGWEPFSHF